MVDEGILHSFGVTQDLFAQGDNRLINHKTYYWRWLLQQLQNI